MEVDAQGNVVPEDESGTEDGGNDEVEEDIAVEYRDMDAGGGVDHFYMVGR